jgi:hypothetical protein
MQDAPGRRREAAGGVGKRGTQQPHEFISLVIIYIEKGLAAHRLTPLLFLRQALQVLIHHPISQSHSRFLRPSHSTARTVLIACRNIPRFALILVNTFQPCLQDYKGIIATE